MKYFKT